MLAGSRRGRELNAMPSHTKERSTTTNAVWLIQKENQTNKLEQFYFSICVRAPHCQNSEFPLDSVTYLAIAAAFNIIL